MALWLRVGIPERPDDDHEPPLSDPRLVPDLCTLDMLLPPWLPPLLLWLAEGVPQLPAVPPTVATRPYDSLPKVLLVLAANSFFFLAGPRIPEDDARTDDAPTPKPKTGSSPAPKSIAACRIVSVGC